MIIFNVLILLSPYILCFQGDYKIIQTKCRYSTSVVLVDEDASLLDKSHHKGTTTQGQSASYMGREDASKRSHQGTHVDMPDFDPRTLIAHYHMF